MIKTEKQIRLMLELMEKQIALELKKYELVQEEKENPIKERQELIQKISSKIDSYTALMQAVDNSMKE